MQKRLIIPDCHIPYENKAALYTALYIAKKIGVSEIIILGDFADFYAVNSHGKDPKYAGLLLQKEIEAVNWWLDFIDRSFPGIHKHYICGNHEYRLDRFIQNKCPELFGLTDWVDLFKLHQRPKWGFERYTKTQLYKIGNTRMHARHEPLSNSSAKASLTNSLVSIIYGHTHRREWFETRNMAGEQLIHTSVGFLGDRKAKHIFGYAVDRKSSGFNFLYEYDDGDFDLHQIRYNDDKKSCIYNGIEFSFKDKRIYEKKI